MRLLLSFVVMITICVVSALPKDRLPLKEPNNLEKMKEKWPEFSPMLQQFLE